MNIILPECFFFLEEFFFQVLEGDKNLLQDLFERILKDPRHYNIIPIFEREIGDPDFDGFIAQFLSPVSHYREKDFGRYLNQVENLNPSIQSSVKYILNNFSEGIY